MASVFEFESRINSGESMAEAKQKPEKDHVIASVTMPLELWARMKQEAEVKQVSLRSIVRAALEEYLHAE